jgi:hypothetical protein
MSTRGPSLSQIEQADSGQPSRRARINHKMQCRARSVTSHSSSVMSGAFWHGGVGRRGGRRGFPVNIVDGVACSRGGRRREHLITVRATEETEIVHQPDVGDARGFTRRTRGWRLQEKAEASLVGGLRQLRPDRSNRPDRDACRFEFLFQIQECIACRLAFEAGTFTAGTFYGVDQGLDARQTRGEEFSLYGHVTEADSSTDARGFAPEMCTLAPCCRSGS